VGSSGEVFRSLDGDLRLDAQSGDRLRLAFADVDGVVLVAAMVVPDASTMTSGLAAAEEVLASLRAA
jgi:hypothetical protein